MAKVWRVIIVALLAAAVVTAFNMHGGKGKTPTDSAIVQKTPAPPAAEKPESAKPAVEPSKTESVKADEPAKQPDKKPETAKPPKAEKPKPKGLPKIVDVGGENCIPCKLMVPILDGMRSEYKGKLEVITLSKDKDPNAMKRYRVSTIPTQILYDAYGKEVARHFGFWAKDEILATFKSHGIDLQEKYTQ